MDAFSTYLISSCLIAFLLVGAECLICSRNTHHRLRRVYYIAAILLSLGLPLVAPLLPDVRFQREVQLPSISIEPLEMEILEIESPTGESNWQQYIEPTAHGVWVAGAATVFLYLCLSLIRLRRVVAKAEEAYGCKRILFLSSMTTPFSFAGRMYLPTELRQTESLVHVFRHERCHIKDGHQWDLLLLWAFLLLHWWNPAAWLLGRKLKANLEYLADQSAILKQESAKTYQYELVRLASSATVPLCNTFNNKHLKQRIIMMNRVDSSIRSKWNYLVALPIAAVGLIGIALFSATAANHGYSVEETTELESSLAADIAPNEDSYTSVLNSTTSQLDRAGENFFSLNTLSEKSKQKKNEINRAIKEAQQAKREALQAAKEARQAVKEANQALNELQIGKGAERTKRKGGTILPPKFPEGEQALMAFLAKNINYPPKAAEAGIQGRVIVRIDLDAQGNITKTKITQSVHPLLDAEALRIVSLMPQWEPATENGRPKTSTVHIPVHFLITSEKSDTSAQNEDDTEIDLPVKSKDGTVYQIADEMPEFPGGMEAMTQYFAHNIKYPKEAIEAKISGRVVVKFTVTKEGAISNAAIIRSVHPVLDEEALRLVNSMPSWQAGKQDGKPVAVEYSLPILFRGQ